MIDTNIYSPTDLDYEDMTIYELIKVRIVLTTDINNLVIKKANIMNAKINKDPSNSNITKLKEISIASQLDFLRKDLDLLDLVIQMRKDKGVLDLIRGPTDHPYFCKKADSHYDYYTLKDFLLESDHLVSRSDILFRYDVEEVEYLVEDDNPEEKSDKVFDDLEGSLDDTLSGVDEDSLLELFPSNQSRHLIKMYFIDQRKGLLFSLYIHQVSFKDMAFIDKFIIKETRKLKRLWPGIL